MTPYPLFRVAKAFSGEERVTVVNCNHKFVPFDWVSPADSKSAMTRWED